MSYGESAPQGVQAVQGVQVSSEGEYKAVFRVSEGVRNTPKPSVGLGSLGRLGRLDGLWQGFSQKEACVFGRSLCA